MIEFISVNKVWPNGVHALKDINLQIKEGEFVAVIGLSGAGKTTLIRCINKMNTISSGKINITLKEKKNDNTIVEKNYSINKIWGKKLRYVRTKIGLISQDYNNIGKQTVLKNVLNARVAKIPFYRSWLGLFSRQDKIIALTALEKLHILDRAFIRAENLSGGQQQRIALARTLAQKPQLIIADEPVSALDPILSNQVMEDFCKINEEEKITIIMNIHHVELALKYAKRIIGIKNGEIVFDGLSQEVNQAVLEKIYGSKYERIE